MDKVQALEDSIITHGTVFYSHCHDNVRGVLLAFERTLDFQEESVCTDDKGRFIIVHAIIQGEPITIANVYLEPSVPAATIATYLSTISEKIAQGGNSRVVICGDFNTVIDPVLDSSNKSRIDVYCQELLSFRSIDFHFNKVPVLNVLTLVPDKKMLLLRAKGRTPKGCACWLSLVYPVCCS